MNFASIMNTSIKFDFKLDDHSSQKSSQEMLKSLDANDISTMALWTDELTNYFLLDGETHPTFNISL